MKLPDAEKLSEQLAAELRPRLTPKSAMIGLYTGGAWLAERLHALLGLKEPLGLMDIAFYRDDYHAQGLHHDPKRTKIPFDVNGRELLLVDDVLYTGRTIRAAMNELFDYGRPPRKTPRVPPRPARAAASDLRAALRRDGGSACGHAPAAQARGRWRACFRARGAAWGVI